MLFTGIDYETMRSQSELLKHTIVPVLTLKKKLKTTEVFEEIKRKAYKNKYLINKLFLVLALQDQSECACSIWIFLIEFSTETTGQTINDETIL